MDGATENNNAVLSVSPAGSNAGWGQLRDAPFHKVTPVTRNTPELTYTQMRVSYREVEIKKGFTCRREQSGTFYV